MQGNEDPSNIFWTTHELLWYVMRRKYVITEYYDFHISGSSFVVGCSRRSVHCPNMYGKYIYPQNLYENSGVGISSSAQCITHMSYMESGLIAGGLQKLIPRRKPFIGYKAVVPKVWAFSPGMDTEVEKTIPKSSSMKNIRSPIRVQTVSMGNDFVPTEDD